MVWLLQGMKRSGNHALVHWLLPQLHCRFINNAIPLGPILRGRPFPPALEYAEWRKQADVASPAEGVALVTLEDHELSVLPFDPAGVELRRLLILRQPKQVFSSRIRKAMRVDMPAYPRENNAVMQRAVRLWKQHARCYLGESRHIYPGRIAVLFDAWVCDRGYREAISAALGVTFDDSGFSRVGGEGGGSSFDGVAFDGRGHLMNVADRISQLDPLERDLLDELWSDPELEQLDTAVCRADPYRALVVG